MAISIVQSAHINVHSGLSVSGSFGSATGAGNTLVAFVSLWRQGSAVAAVTLGDSQGQSFANLWNATSSPSNTSQVGIYILENGAGGADTIGVESALSQDINLDILELSGVPSVGTIDAYIGHWGNLTSGVALNSGSIVSKVANEFGLAFAFDISNTADTFTASSGFTQVLQNNNATGGSGGTGMCSTVFAGAASTVGSYSNNFTSNKTSSGFYSLLIAFTPTTLPKRRVSQVVAEGVITGTPNVRLTQEALEAIIIGTPNTRISQAVLEGIIRGSANVRLSQAVLEGIIRGSANVRLSQAVIEAVISNIAFIRVSQFVMEAVITQIPAPPTSSFIRPVVFVVT